MSELTVERCPSLEDLLLALEGELPSTEQTSVSAHLSRCATCHATVRDAMAMVDTFVAGVHTAPNFSEEAARARHMRFMGLLHDHKRARAPRVATLPIRRLLPMAAVMPLIIVGFLSQTHQVVVQADELLERAATVERRRPAGSAQRLRMRLLPNDTPLHAMAKPSFTGIEELTDGMTVIGPTATVPDGMPETLARLLEQHQFDWRQPFSVARFKMLRGTLVHRHDRVIEDTLTGQPVLVLRATADDGDLREAELIVERDTFHVIRETFVFQGVGRLEIEEVAQWVRHAEPPRETPAAAAVAAALPDRDALERAELDARWMLAEGGQDLGGTVRMSSTRELLRIDGVLGDANVRRAISNRFAPLPYVRVSLRVRGSGDTTPANGAHPGGLEAGHDAAGHDASGRDAAASVSTSPWLSAEPVSNVSTFVARPALSRWVDRTLGNDAARATFVSDLSHHVSMVRQRVRVLSDLAQRYREQDVRQLSPAAQATFQQLLALHYRELNRDVQALKAPIAVLYRSENLEPATTRLAADWRHRITGALPQAAALDRLMQELLTYDDLPATEQHQVGTTFAALWAAMYSTGSPPDSSFP